MEAGRRHRGGRGAPRPPRRHRPTGVPLDGEWANAGLGSDAFRSGDGAPGGDFALRLNVLPGDANRDGSISDSDVSLLRSAEGVAPGVGPYSIVKDINGSGSILGNATPRRCEIDTVPSCPPANPPPQCS
jgi:hypothetical protein